MNNDSTPSSATDLPPGTTPSDPTAVPNEDAAGSREQQQVVLSPTQKRVQSQTKKKYEFVTSLVTNLDVLIYAELCILYYME